MPLTPATPDLPGIRLLFLMTGYSAKVRLVVIITLLVALGHRGNHPLEDEKSSRNHDRLCQY